MEGIGITVDNIGALKDIVYIRIGGYIDTTTSPQLQQALFQLIQQGANNFIVDLTTVQYVSSAGWGVFVGEIRGLRERGGDLKIINMTSEVNEVFEMLEFNRILTYYDSLEEALDDFDYSRAIDFSGKNGTVQTHPQRTIVKAEVPVQQTKAPLHEDRPVSSTPILAPSSRCLAL